MVKLRLEQNLRKCRKEQAPQGRAPSFFLQQKNVSFIEKKKKQKQFYPKRLGNERKVSSLSLSLPP